MKLLNGWKVLRTKSPLDQCLEQVLTLSMCNVCRGSRVNVISSTSELGNENLCNGFGLLILEDVSWNQEG